MPAPVDSVLTFTEALGTVGVDARDSVYWAGRATLVHRPEDIATYDRAFAAFWEQRAGPAGIEPEPELVHLTIAVDDGADTVGTVGGVTRGSSPLKNQLQVTLNGGTVATPTSETGVNYDFGEILGARLSGFVYLDTNDNGVKEPGEAPLPAVTVTLTGTDDLGHAVTLTTTAAEVSARLVLGADGAQSALRAAAGLTITSADYHQIAIVANVATGKAHAHSAWQRFMKDGTLAFLPLADGTSSIVWSADEARAHELLAAGAGEFAHALDRASDLVLGPTRLTTERRSFALQRLAAQRYVAPRVALLGDALFQLSGIVVVSFRARECVHHFLDDFLVVGNRGVVVGLVATPHLIHSVLNAVEVLAGRSILAGRHSSALRRCRVRQGTSCRAPRAAAPR